MEHVRKFGIWARSELAIGHDVRRPFRTGGHSDLGAQSGRKNQPACQFGFWATVCKMVRPILWTAVCVLCPVHVGVLWPNGWMDQDATWYELQVEPGSGLGHDIVPPLKGHSPQFSAHVLWPNG